MFAAFFRDNIKRVTISGTMILPQVSQKLPALFDKPKAHAMTPLCVGEKMVGFSLIEMFEGDDLRSWQPMDRSLCAANKR